VFRDADVLQCSQYSKQRCVAVAVHSNDALLAPILLLLLLLLKRLHRSQHARTHTHRQYNACLLVCLSVSVPLRPVVLLARNACRRTTVQNEGLSTKHFASSYARAILRCIASSLYCITARQWAFRSPRPHHCACSANSMHGRRRGMVECQFTATQPR